MRFLIALAFSAIFCFQAEARVCTATQTVTASTVITNSLDDHCVYVDTSGGTVTLTFDPPSTFGQGEVTIKKIGVVSSPVILNGSFEQSQSQLRQALEGDSLTLHSDGITWKMVSSGGLADQRGWSHCRSEHDISTTSNTVNPQDGGYCYAIDVCSAGASVWEGLPAISAVTFDHQNFSIKFIRLDSCNNPPPGAVVSIVANSVPDTIRWNHVGSATSGTCGSGGLCKIDLTTNYQVVDLWAQGVGVGWIVTGSQGF